MLSVFTAREMRELDRRAIQDLNISGATLMENAGTGAAREIRSVFGPPRGQNVVVLSGKGNNGGDGFVVARALKRAGARVDCFLLGAIADVTGDAAVMLRKFRRAGGRVTEVIGDEGVTEIGRALRRADFVVDALLGTGLTGPAQGLSARVIGVINAGGRPVVALDLPSGLSSDGGSLLGPTVVATLTTTFAGLKRGLLLYPGGVHAGMVRVVPTGIAPAEVSRNVSVWLLEPGDIRPLFPPRAPDAHKGTFGHLLVVAGAVGKTGAAAMAGRAGLRSGAGLVTIASPQSQQPIVATLAMETMTEPLAETPSQSLALKAKDRILDLSGRVDALALGPGLSLDSETQSLVRELVAEVPRPMVIDADGLTALAGHLDLLRRAPAPRCLTPHPGEMARMLRMPVAAVQADRIGSVQAFCQRYKAFLALKGARTVIGDPAGNIFLNPTGNPGMASGGAGDVLTGMVGAFLGRGMAPLEALQAGVYLHGLAGDQARDDKGEEGLIAGDILEAIPGAFRSIRERAP